MNEREFEDAIAPVILGAATAGLVCIVLGFLLLVSWGSLLGTIFSALFLVLTGVFSYIWHGHIEEV